MRLRILCTNDFLSSLSPSTTSYGMLPGARALQAKVAELREGQPTIWADAGDFTQGGPLSTETGGTENFTAAGELGIEVATVGNHELDWGTEFLAEHRKKLPFALICANLDLGLPPTALLQTDAGPVGFIGLTHPEVHAFTPYADRPNQDLDALVPAQAEMLRAEGATAVIVLIHFGVNWRVNTQGGHVPDPEPVLELCRPLAPTVDAIVLGHTLGRWSGVIDGTPYAQPWAFGAELGVIDLDLTTRNHTVRLLSVDARRERWNGAGASQIERAEQAILGQIPSPLQIDFATDTSLADYAAHALREAAGTTGAIVPVVGMHQPAKEGVMYRWPAGPVTEADLSRFWPWTDDTTLTAELTPAELQTITSFTAPEPWLAWGTSALPLRGDKATIAVPKDYVDWGTIQIEQLLSRELDWRPSEVRLREAMREVLRASR